jgi:hypothetical protein
VQGDHVGEVPQLQFQLDDDQLETLKEALIEAERLADDEDGKVLVWSGRAPTPAAPVPEPPGPRAYCP